MSTGTHHQESLARALEVEFEEASKPSISLEPRPSCRQPGELSDFPLLVWPGTHRLGWFACFLGSEFWLTDTCKGTQGMLGCG